MRRRFHFILAVAVSALALMAAEPTETAMQKRYREALDSVAALPIEASADLTFALIDTGGASSAVAVRSLQRIYQRAGEAVRETPAVFAPIQEGSNKALQYEQVIDAFSLDGLSIKLRAIKRLAQLDKKAALSLAGSDLFLYKFPVDIPCSSIRIPYPGRFYYPTLLESFPERFSEIVQTMQTPQQIAMMSDAFAGSEELRIQPYRVSVQRYSEFASQVSTVLTHPVSDRVFMAGDAKLSMIASLLKFSRSDEVCRGQLSIMAQAWVNYAVGQLKRRRCGDVRTPEGEDFAIKYTLARIVNLSKNLGLAAVDSEALKKGFQYSTEVYKPSETGDPEPVIADLSALTAKVELGGNDGAREQLIVALQRYGARDKELLTKDLNHSDAVYRLVSQALMEFDIATKVNDSRTENVAIGLFFDDVNSERLRTAEPTAWVMCMRFALNLLKHPSPSVSAYAREQLARSNSPAVAVYRTINESLGLVPTYQSGLLATPLKVAGAF